MKEFFSQLFTKQFNAMQNLVRMMKTGFFRPESTTIITLENTEKIDEWDFRWGYFWQFAVGRFEKVLKILFEYCSKWFSKTSLLLRRILFLLISLYTSSWGRLKITRGNEVTQNLQTFYSHSISVKISKKWRGQKIGKVFVSFRCVSLRKDQDKICLEYIYSVFKFLNFILFSVIITLKKIYFFCPELIFWNNSRLF